METRITDLLNLQKELPEEYTEENLLLLEQIVTRYKVILNQTAEMQDPENQTLYYRERITALESDLTKSKYEHSDKQRNAAFSDAKKYTEEGLTALILFLSNLNTTEEVK